jgi:hypothetical protein
MATSQVEYVGFRNGDTTREYSLRVRHPDGQCDEFTLAIEQQAFVTHRVRYQDGAEICFLKLCRALEAWALAPESGPPEARQNVTDADLLEYSEGHKVKPRRTGPPPPRTPTPVGMTPPPRS